MNLNLLDLWQAYLQIGNAVPPKLAEVLGDFLTNVSSKKAPKLDSQKVTQLGFDF